MIITVLIFTLILSLIGLSFMFLSRIFPSATLEFQKHCMFTGVRKELSEYTPSEGAGVYSAEELKAVQNTEFNNSLVLISADKRISEHLSFDSVCEYKDSDVFFDSIAHNAYQELSAQIYDRYKTKLYIMSAYRSNEEQAEIFEEQGPSTAQRPGESEHQSGLALDVYVSGYAGASFLKTDVGKYVNTYSYRFGFIIRYPDEKENITGISFEPWHLRYVGHPHAEIMTMSGLTLEEYLLALKNNVYYSYDDYVILKASMDSKISIPDSYDSLVISPDNCGNYIYTFHIDNN